MADKDEHRDENQVVAGEQSHRSEYGDQAAEHDGTAGQPIGGNDSKTGSGTPLTQGFAGTAPGAAGPAGYASAETDRPSDPESGISHGGTASAEASGDSFGQGTTSNAGGSTVGIDQTSGGSSGVSGGRGFIGSQSDDSDERQAESASSGEAKGNEFARDGRGALEHGSGQEER